jgi:hypothetical protein
METEILVFTREPSDINGNPRYVVDYDALMSADERNNHVCKKPMSELMEITTKRANSIGGKKVRGRWAYVFQSYSIQATANAIGRVTGRKFEAVKP